TITHRDYETEKHYLNLLRQRRIDGAILFTSALPAADLDALAAQWPLVQCGAYASGPHVSHTSIDNVAAAYEAVDHLLRSRRRVGFLNGRFGRAYELERLAGYQQALAAHNYSFNEAYVVQGGYAHTDGYEGCRALMALPEAPGGIFCCCDQVAAGACKYLLEQGLTPGRDVDVIGFDGTYISELCTPALSTVRQPAYEMGQTAFGLLAERMQNQQSLTKKVVMPHELVLRQSTRPLPE
ncbi:substrate-binding domain-containing protein, partial [Ruminococcaceae bacterium OttesenSCG-928-D13]|nr:substrate-binding domain-containing protein [Ruminococcaceae bacterium OttesenSCG-928-D13]